LTIEDLKNSIIFLVQNSLNSLLVDYINYSFSFIILRLLKLEVSNYFANMG